VKFPASHRSARIRIARQVVYSSCGPALPSIMISDSSVRSSRAIASMRSILEPVLSGFILAMLAGCATAPKSAHDELSVRLPSAWAAARDLPADRDVPADWLSALGDPQLERIVVEALAFNQDIKQAVARLDAALASTTIGKSETWPQLGVGGSGDRRRRSQASGVSQTSFNESFGLNARFSWEIDLWGKVRNATRAELADAQAALADFDATRLSLAARVAKAWYAAVEAEQQLALERRILESLSDSSRIVEESFSSGIAGALDVRLVRANMASSRSALEQRRRSRDATARALETLLGRYPSNEIALAAGFPEIEPEAHVGIPSELLLRRPDIIAAERRLAAAEQRKFEAGKARLPSFDFTFNRGTSAEDLDGVFDFVGNRIWSQSLSVAHTLFAGNRLKANHRRARALHEQATASFVQTVLTACREVEDALSEQDSYALDYAALKEAASESVAAEELAWDEYSSGLVDITTVLDAARRSISAQRASIRVANLRIQSRIDLYLALGGGVEARSVPEA